MNRLSLQILTTLFFATAFLAASVSSLHAKNPIPSCASFEACRALEGQLVEVIGVYTVMDATRTKGPQIYSNVRIVFPSDKHGATLEPYWSPKSRRDAEEIARFQGKLVAVLGRYASLTPLNPAIPASPSRFTMPTILEVDSVQLVDEKSPALPK